MKESCLIDFHRCWLIEIVPVEHGFKATCCSPCRNQFVIDVPHDSHFEVLHLAKREIDHQIACNTIIAELRELYEAGQLCLEEWHALRRSLK